MKVFTPAEGKFKEIANKYKRGGETAFVSVPIEFNGKKFREIVFKKKTLLGKIKEATEGTIYLTESGEVVTDQRDKRELTNLAYNMENLLDEAFIKNLSKSIIPIGELKREEMEYSFIKESLEPLVESSFTGAEAVKNVIVKLPELRKENNEVIQGYIEKTNSYNPEGFVFTKQIQDDLKFTYTESLMKNFEKVKLISKGGNYYPDVKKEMLKQYKKRFIGSMGSNMSGSASRIEYHMNYLVRVIDLYQKIVNLSENEYRKYLSDLEKNNTNNKLEKVRA